jgi:hypothetical protein
MLVSKMFLEKLFSEKFSAQACTSPPEIIDEYLFLKDSWHSFSLGENQCIHILYREIDKIENNELIRLLNENEFKKIIEFEEFLLEGFFLCIRYSNSDELMIFRVKELEYLTYYPNQLINHLLSDFDFDSQILPSAENNTTEEKHDDDPIKEQKLISYFQKNKKYILSICAIILFSLFSLSFFSSETGKKDIIRKKTENYYEVVQSEHLDALNNYLAPELKSWFGKQNITQEKAIKDAKRFHRKKYKTTTTVDWETYKFKEIDQFYYIEYKAKRQILKKKKTELLIQVNSIWNKDFKIISLNEKIIDE